MEIAYTQAAAVLVFQLKININISINITYNSLRSSAPRFGPRPRLHYCFARRYDLPDTLLKHNKKKNSITIGAGKFNGSSLDTGCCDILSFYSFGTCGNRFPADKTPMIHKTKIKSSKSVKKCI